MFAQLFTSIRSLIVRYPFGTVLVAITLAGAGWWVWGQATSTAKSTRYMFGVVSENTVVSSVSASGQVASSQQLDLKPKVSGQIMYIGAQAGDHVASGALIAEIDPSDALKAVRDAQANLDSAKLSLQKLQQPPTTLTLTQQQNAISQSQQALLTQYQSGFGDITSTFLDLPAIISSLQDIDFGTTASDANTQWNIDYYKVQAEHYNPAAVQYRDAAFNDYTAARKSYDQTFADFKSLTSTPDQAAIEKILNETYKTTGLVATAAKSSYDLVQFYSDQLTQNGFTVKTVANTQITTLNSYQTKLQTHLTSLLGDRNNLATDKNSIVEKQQSLDQTNSGTNSLDLASAQLTVVQRQNALADANQTLSNYYIRAPFAGTISAVAVHKYDQAGSGTAVATLITPQLLADLSLNEVDAAKLKIGQRAILTFDALPNLTLTGEVAEIDPVGTVAQGVVSYAIKISFDAQNKQIKSGMTVNASVQNAVHQNVLTVPQSAVKTQSGQKYILVFIPPIASSTVAAAGSAGILSKAAPQQVPVEIGISDDTNIEITAGVTAGEQVVTRSILSGSTAQTTAQTGSGNNRGGGIRIP